MTQGINKERSDKERSDVKNIFEDIIGIACLCIIGYGILLATWVMQ